MHALVQVAYPCVVRFGTAIELFYGGRILASGTGFETAWREGGVVSLVEGDVMIAGDDEFELCGVAFEGCYGGCMFLVATDCCEVAGVDEDVLWVSDIKRRRVFIVLLPMTVVSG